MPRIVHGTAALALVLCLGVSVPEQVKAADEDPTASLEEVAAASGSEISRPEETVSVHGQSTYVWQYKPAFSAAYSGPKSLVPSAEHGYSWSATVSVGLRLWQGASVFLDPELIQGVAFSDSQGLGGLANAELAKAAIAHPTIYRARLFLRQEIALGNETESVDSNFHQLAGLQSKRRIVVTAGNLSVLDVFNSLEYAHDPRSEYLNTAFASHASFDFPADARGYTWGAAVEYIDGDWAVRVGRFLQPLEPNGLQLDTRVLEHYGDMLELEHGYTLLDNAGKARLLIWRNHAHMGAFNDALALADRTGGAPDVGQVRREHAKVGAGVSLEQKIGKSLGVYARGDWADDKTESYAFTEVGRSASAGAILKGGAWGRAMDSVGVAVAINGLSTAHQQYLARGGLGGFLGDGALRYGPEQICEVFYSLAVERHLFVSPDLQYIRHPGYNRDRGPARFYGVRVHAQF
ncbi:carbohydrate porin [Cupriavidus plantarum]|uniref:carbohydrate porin n=1 Tax=Cupriavidus plantarum TaxID=942865 RepID=UPI00339D8318